MATLKKPMKKKDGGKPSTFLIIALVFFILTNIGAGVAAYYGYEGQNKLLGEAKDAKKAVSALKNLDDYRMGVIQLLLSSVGKDVDNDNLERAKKALEETLKDGGQFANEKDRKLFIDWLEEVKNKELAFDGTKFTENYRTKLSKALKDLKDAETQLDVTKVALKAEQAKYNSYENKNDAFAKDRNAQIAKNQAATLAIVTKNTEAFVSLEKLNKEFQDANIDLQNKLKEAQNQVKIEEARAEKIREAFAKKNPDQDLVPIKKSHDQHALFLDVSRGIPLWDQPVGKVTRVDLERREIFINLGSAAGVRPELTFNIFADNGKGHADKFLKGTCEIIRVIDAQSSLGRITSLYDAAGVEIALGEGARGRITREVEAAVREGDLLFNMFWNTRVAIAGGINFTGFPVDAPSEQMRQIEMFSQLLFRMGIHTDAILDLNDGQMKGAISNKTRFLILGDPAHAKDPTDDAQKERAKLINDGIAAMKKDAIEKGVFLISAENFTIAAGYRKPRNANNTEVGKFGSTVPFAGAATGAGLIIQRDGGAPAAAPIPMPKKEPEEKEIK